jgi:hypothetical protein
MQFGKDDVYSTRAAGRRFGGRRPCDESCRCVGRTLGARSVPAYGQNRIFDLIVRDPVAPAKRPKPPTTVIGPE